MARGLEADTSKEKPVEKVQINMPLYRSLRSAVWKIQTLLHKKRIWWEDRLGWFGYTRWVRTVEKPALNAWLKQAKHSPSNKCSVTFVMQAAELEQQAGLRTVKSVLHLPGDDVSMVFLLTDDAPVLNTDWFVRLLEQNPQRLKVIRIQGSSQGQTRLQSVTDLPGDWVVPIDPGDIVSAHWLALFQLFLERNPGAEILYWDEDRQDTRGRRQHPFFKPDWSPDLLFSTHYMQCAAFSKDLLLRCLPDLSHNSTGWIFTITAQAAHIAHIPAILQHRKFCIPQALVEDQEHHARAVASALHQRGLREVAALINTQGQIHAKWKMDFPLVSIVIPTKNNLDFIKRCVSSLLEKTHEPLFEILLMDDHSTDAGVLTFYDQIRSTEPRVQIHENSGPFNYSRVNNTGARLAKGDLILFLNNDIEIIDEGWLAELTRWIMLDGVGMVGAKLLYPDRSIQHAGIVIGMTGHAAHLYAGQPPTNTGLFLSPDMVRNVSSVTGACMLVRREVFEQVGGFDEELGLVFNDAELGLRFWRHGYRVVYTPWAQLIHYEGRSRAHYIPKKDIRRGAALLSSEVARGDPYYNPNLSYAVNWPTFRRPGDPAPAYQLERIAYFKGED